MIFYIDSDDEVDVAIQSMLKCKGCFAVDTETTSLDVFEAKLLLLQVGVENNTYVFNAVKLSRLGEVVDTIIKTDRTCIAHNAKYDSKIIMATLGKEIKNWYDTMYIEVMLNAGIGKKFYSLAHLVEKYCGVELDKDVRMNFIEKVDGEFTQEEILYAANDVIYLPEIMKKQLVLSSEAKELDIVDIESRLIAPVASMEFNGITLDRKAWDGILMEAKALANVNEKTLMDMLMPHLDFNGFYSATHACEFLNIPIKTKRERTELDTIQSKEMIEKVVRKLFSPTSNKQIKKLLEYIYGIELGGVGKKAINDLAHTTDVDTSILENLIEFRMAKKKVTTYGTKFLEHINPITGRVHAQFHNIGTDTGRFSSSKPNMQNIPRDELYRQAFVARPGYKIIGIDYSQQEYRLAGALSGEIAIINAYIEGLDMHTATASILFGVSAKDVTKEQRNYGKTINFAIIYGTSAWGLSNNMKITMEKAEETMEAFFAGYPRLAKFKDTVEEKILDVGYSITALGRRRYNKVAPLFGTPKERSAFYARVKREGFNHIIQGTAADITKLAMLNIAENNPYDNELRMLLQVHDEVICEAREDIAEEAYLYIQEQMIDAEQPFLGSIPAVADGYISDSWEKA